MMSLFDDKQADIIDAFNITSRYLDDILNINYIYLEYMVSRIYLTELQLNNVNTPNTEVSTNAKFRNRYNQVPHLTQDTTWGSDKNSLLDLHLLISNDIVYTKICNKCNAFDFEVVNFLFRWLCSSFYIIWNLYF